MFADRQSSVLVVDDEEVIRRLVQDTLLSFGYSVFLASDGEEALELLEEKVNEIDLVILDVVMPGLKSSQVLQRMKELDSSLPVIVSSGFDIEGPVRELLDMGAVKFIEKPYRVEDLIQAVEEVLGKRGKR